MSRETWEIIKNSKSFYVKTYRRVSTMIIMSLVLNVILVCGIYYSYFNQPTREFYATNGVTPPVKLKPLAAANESAQALLAPDPNNIEAVKEIPQ
ncbi:type IVB secretion system protein IcmM/DotJ [Legionella spiritensis]|uniref:type IVB secretion system protein IcmM/DotJ n=1 Tax=Legionella spiritensis TaxID=452 RepID=UPI000F6C8D43|nr:type IVB secretion system protein IcmM/DotJ [Legionella spiritensis]VEG90790.1 Component of the Dot/Icm secretion system. inner membrane protein [Legionella spiritensis]